MEGGQYLPRADLASLKRVFNKYSSLSKDGIAFLSYEDLIVRWLILFITRIVLEIEEIWIYLFSLDFFVKFSFNASIYICTLVTI